MRHAPNGAIATNSGVQALLTYVADLELEVDRLRRQNQCARYEVQQNLARIRTVIAHRGQDANSIEEFGKIEEITAELAAALRDLQEPSGYHPAHDQVVAIAIRPLVEKVFRMQQRLAGASHVVLRIVLDSEHVEWFPARLRHILDNLLANSLRFRDSSKHGEWVEFGLRVCPEAYEIRVSDNGIGLPVGLHDQVFNLFYRAAPARAAGVAVDLAVVKMLVEQSGGSMRVDSNEGCGAVFVVVVPRYDIDDFLT